MRELGTNGCHFAASAVKLGGESGRKEINDLGLAPSQFAGGDIRDRAFARGMWCACQPSGGVEPTEKIAGRMALATMTERLNKISAALDLGR